MNDESYRYIMEMAMDKLSTNGAPDYWTGYMRGLRRRREGKRFCSREEHHQWLTASGDDSSNARAKGYRDGYGCTKNDGNCMTCEHVDFFALDCNHASVGLRNRLRNWKKAD